VRLEFLLEGAALGVLGAFGGAGAGALLGRLFADLAGFPAGAWFSYMCLTAFVATVFRVAASLWPASQAAFVQPMEALRMER
jgi:ABC-type antimicrobial peptide transport system permease subunit